MMAWISILLIPFLSWSHGEEKAGPHGGHIRMPGAFHTETIMDDQGSFHIFLLDMDFKNPTAKDSEVSAWVQQGQKKINLSCSVMGGNHFHCKDKKPVRTGELVLKTKRDKQQGNEVKYTLPLKSFESIDHSNH